MRRNGGLAQAPQCEMWVFQVAFFLKKGLLYLFERVQREERKRRSCVCWYTLPTTTQLEQGQAEAGAQGLWVFPVGEEAQAPGRPLLDSQTRRQGAGS